MCHGEPGDADTEDCWSVWVGFVCLKCRALTTIDIGAKLIDPQWAFETANWPCQKCGYVHSKDSDLPFKDWPPEFTNHKSLKAERFWLGFSALLRNTLNLTGSNAMPAAVCCPSTHLANTPTGEHWSAKWNVAVARGQSMQF